jgi:hypothetical protein
MRRIVTALLNTNGGADAPPFLHRDDGWHPNSTSQRGSA